jgi:hypothetical protein
MNNYEIETTFKTILSGDKFKLINKTTKTELMLVKAGDDSACIEGDYVHIYLEPDAFIFIQGNYDSEPIERCSNRQRIDSYA